LLLNHGFSEDITGTDGPTPLRAAACNFHLEVAREMLSNGGIVHIARKSDLTAILAAADSDRVGVFREFL